MSIELMGLVIYHQLRKLHTHAPRTGETPSPRHHHNWCCYQTIL